MTIFLNILFLIIGLALLIKGADFFVSSASSIAKKFKIPSIFIGITIVSLGTSLPEFSISLFGAISNSSDFAIGNIVGSNLSNMLLILPLTMLCAHIPIHKSTKKTDIPFLCLVSGLLLLFSLDNILNGHFENIISRSESIIFILILIIYLTICILNLKQQSEQNKNESTTQEELEKKILKPWQIILYLILGIGAVAFGGECVSTTAQYLALQMGMSEALVGLTIVAFGTSLPELVTSIIAARKNEVDLALGNIIGSNIMNISFILGVVGVINQAPVSNIILTDIIILFASTIVFTIICLTSKKLGKKQAVLLLLMYIAYLTFAIIRNYCF